VASDWERDQLRKYLRQDKNFTDGALATMVAAGFGAFCVTCALTQPWPRKGPGGGYGTNIAGPGITMLVTLAVVLILGKLLRRKTPPQVPRIGLDEPQAPPPPWQSPPPTKKP